MWYQQSPVVGDGLGWGLEAAHLAASAALRVERVQPTPVPRPGSPHR